MGCELEFYSNADEAIAQIKDFNFQRVLLMPSSFVSMDSMLYFHAWLKAINPRPALVALISSTDESEQLMQVFSAMGIFIFNPNGEKIKQIWLASLLTDSVAELERKYGNYKYKTQTQQVMAVEASGTPPTVISEKEEVKGKGSFLNNIFGGLKKQKTNGKAKGNTSKGAEPAQQGTTPMQTDSTVTPAPIPEPAPAPTPTPISEPMPTPIPEPVSATFDVPDLSTMGLGSDLGARGIPDMTEMTSDLFSSTFDGTTDSMGPDLNGIGELLGGTESTEENLSAFLGGTEPTGEVFGGYDGSSFGFNEVESAQKTEEQGMGFMFSGADVKLSENMEDVLSAVADKATAPVSETRSIGADYDADMLSSILSEPVVSQPVMVDEADLPDENLKSIRADANTVASSLTVDDVLVSEKPKVITKEVVKEVVREVAGGKGRYASVKSGASPLYVIVTGERRSGKTTTAIRLSESIAKDRVRTLFVDFDIERQNSLLYLNLPGLVEQPLFVQQGVFLCQNEEDLSKAIWTTADISFSSLVSLPTDDTNLMGKQTLDNLEKVAEMLASQDLFQAVVVDCPLEVLPYVTALLDDCLVVTCIDSDESAISNFIYYFSKLDLSTQKKNRILKSMMLYAVKCKGADVKAVKSEVLQFKKSLEQFTEMYSQEKLNLPASRIINLNSVDKFIKEKL